LLAITRHHDFSAGHRVLNHEGSCKNLHGHNYRVHFTCRALHGEVDSLGRVVDFAVIKARLCAWIDVSWDHRFLMFDQDPALEALRAIDDTVVALPFNPTAEALAVYLLGTIGPSVMAGTGVTLVAVRLEETRRCSAVCEL